MKMSLNKKITLVCAILFLCSGISVLTSENLLLNCSALYAQSSSSQQEIQAAMIIKFTDFIEWPPDSFDQSSDEFTIAVLGENEYKGLFEPFTKRVFHGRKLKIVNYTNSNKIYENIENLGKIQILIISSSEKDRIAPLIDKLKTKPVLTIADFPGFAANGGIINFFRKADNRIGFEINTQSKDLANIKISAHLLKLAKIVNEQNSSRFNNSKESTDKE